MPKIELRLREILKERNITQSELAARTDIRPATINALARGNVERLSLTHVATIMKELKIDDMNVILKYEE